MQETANAKLNNLIPLPYSQAYIKMPTDLKNLPSSCQLFGGLIYSFSGIADKDGILSTISRSRKIMKDSLTLSFSALSRAAARLTADGFVSRLSRDEYIFNRDKLKSPDEFIRIEINEIKEITGGFKRLQGVKLRVFSLFNTRCNNDKKCLDKETEALRKEHKTALSYADIAYLVGCSPRRAISAVKWLLKNDFIHRPEADKGTSLNHKSIYSLDRAYWRRKRQKDITPSAENNPAETPEQQAKIARQNELARIKDRAVFEAERNEQRARRSERYRLAHSHVTELAVKIAFAELNEPEKAALLELELTRWRTEEAAALKALGLSRELLDEGYLFKLYASGGAPPDGDNIVGAGELNN